MRVLRSILLALLFSLLFGLVLGTVLRMRLERPIWYLAYTPERSAPAPRPLDVIDTRARVFDARHHEQQIG